MSAAHLSRIERLKQLEACLPAEGRADRYPDIGRLLDLIGDIYEGASESATRRALQRDLKELVHDGRIAIVNPNGKPLRYRHVMEDPDDDPAVWDWLWKQVLAQAGNTLTRRQLDTRIQKSRRVEHLARDALRFAAIKSPHLANHGTSPMIARTGFRSVRADTNPHRHRSATPASSHHPHNPASDAAP